MASLMGKLFRGAAVASLACAWILANGQVGPGVTDDTILIGMEGPANSFSTDEENLGMHLVIAQVNEQGGIHGRTLEVRSYPRAGGAATDEAVANAQRLVEDDNVFLLFNFGGPASVEVAPYAMEKQVPYLFPHTALVTLDGARYVFTSYPRYLGESQVMYQYLAETRGLTKIAIVYHENVYGRFFLDRLKEYAGRYGYLVTGSRSLIERNPADLSSDMEALRQTGPDAIVMALYPAQARRVMEAKAALEWKDVTMVSAGPLTDEQYLNDPGGYAEGTLGFCHYPDPTVATEPGIREYQKQMKTYYPGRPLNRYSLYGYAFGRLVVAGLQRAGRDLTRETFIDAMETIDQWESGGIMPPVSFSKTSHHAQRAGFICELREERFTALTDWIEP